jgi:hypothetical protein
MDQAMGPEECAGTSSGSCQRSAEWPIGVLWHRRWRDETAIQPVLRPAQYAASSYASSLRPARTSPSMSVQISSTRPTNSGVRFSSRLRGRGRAIFILRRMLPGRALNTITRVTISGRLRGFTYFEKSLRAAGNRFLNEGPVWSAASSNENGEDGRKADPIGLVSPQRSASAEAGAKTFLGRSGAR